MRKIATLAGSMGILLALLLPLGAQEEPPTADSGPGKAYFWFRMWPDYLVKYDIESDQVVLKIKNENGISHGHYVSHDRKRIYMITGKRTMIEVIDVERGVIADVHPFQEAGFIIRVSDIVEIPGGTHWYIKVDKIKQELDHFVIQDPQWLHYDVAAKKIEKQLKELPKPIRRGARISPCGTRWHVFGRDITIVNPATLEEEGKIELSRPLYSGMGPISLSGDDFYERKNPDAYRMMYRMRDPLKKNRSLAGIIDIDIKGQKIADLHEWGAAPPVWGLQLTKDKKLGFGQKRGGDRGRQSDGEDPVITLLTYEVDTGKKLRETRVEVRNGLSLRAISPDGKKLYMTGRGHELVIYDDQHQYVKTVELDGETDGQLVLLEE